MASSDNIEPWMTGRPDSEACVTKALQMSFSDDNLNTPISSDFSIINLLNFSGSLLEPETSPLPKVQRPVVGGAVGGNGKSAGGVSRRRKPRASKKRSQTTFIAADPANFRQMVQQVTGVKLVGGDWRVPPVVVKPAALRPPGGSSGLPKPETSSLLLGGQTGHFHLPYPVPVHHRLEEEVTPADGPGSSASGPGPLGYSLEALSGFPTLESWKVPI